MSLRARVVALIGAVLLISMLMGVMVAGYQVRHALAAELAAGLVGGRQTVDSALEDLPISDHPARDLRQLIATFDGNRHVRAVLQTGDGRTAWASRPGPTGPTAPPWFSRLLGSVPPSQTIRVPATAAGASAIVLTPVSEIDVGAAWREFVGIASVLLGSAAIGLVLVYFVISAAFRPLRALATQFGRVGAGDYSGRVAEDGPSELLTLQRGFNRMAAELSATTDRNRLLSDQLLTIQEEERADIARDLHDDIGPHLFAVNMDAETIAQLSGASRDAPILVQVRSIQASVSHMQRQVRALLERLRPARMTEMGLNAAILELVRFWSARRPETTFKLALLEDEGQLPEAAKDVIYRVAQEAANNAVRHGDPNVVAITLEIDQAQVLHLSVSDDGAGLGAPAAAGGLGLIGMRERIVAVGGAVSFGPNIGEAGWMTEAWLPLGTGAAIHAPTARVA
jgi:two-component system sensor histidine kinase UhpB